MNVLLILHGLITAGQSGGSFKPAGGLPNPAFVAWWPINLGKSWLLSRLGTENTVVGTLAGVLWLASAASLVAAGLGLLGLVVPMAWWRTLAGVGAGMNLLMLILYAHPIYLIATAADLAVLLVLLPGRWPPAGVLGS